MTLDSTINDSAYYHPEEDDAEIDPNSDPKVATHTSDGKKRKVTDTDTTNRNYTQKLLIIQTIPVIVSPIYLPIVDKVAASRGNLHAVRVVPLK